MKCSGTSTEEARAENPAQPHPLYAYVHRNLRCQCPSFTAKWHPTVGFVFPRHPFGLQRMSPHAATASLLPTCRTAGAYDTLACLENNVEWVWPFVFILNTHHLSQHPRGDDFLMVTNPFGCPFRRSGFGSSIPEVAPSTEKPHSEKEEMENPYTDIFGCQIELQTPRGKEVLF